ncbi:AVAST type 1 anti-phage system MBL fold metallo-hydrolase Avs1a, partial [Chryseobacterium sp. Leaf201]|uniref:AVAST type 1 anti-phage system MBL fold metallo-hydrolase Avs1a n=1 Tax=Chryseobacterium sp. Leaf201 TaxID=1735672 RepID=UPI0006F98ECC
MTLTIYPANNGDSFLLEIKDTIILIDGGYVDTYKNYIKPKLFELAKENKKISHLIVTHIDNDHISGIIKFIEENKKNSIIEITNIWHNSFRHINCIDDNLIFKGKPLSRLVINYTIKEENNTVEKNISAVQGSTLASLIHKYQHSWNSEFNENAISTDNELEIKISEDIYIKVLSPNNNKLKDLKKYWKKELFKKGFSSDSDLSDFNEDAFEYILSLEKERRRLQKKKVSSSTLFNIEEFLNEPFVEDDTATNGSSISFIIEFKNTQLLFLADSHPTVIINSLKKHYKQEEFPLQFDLIKVSHHGSKNNTSVELLNYIDSDKFIFSTNGLTHNHPDNETIARIVCRKTKFTRNLYFNYNLDSIECFKNKSFETKFNYKIIESSN